MDDSGREIKKNKELGMNLTRKIVYSLDVEFGFPLGNLCLNRDLLI